MADAIRALQPGYVIIENVPGIATKMGSRPGESALGTVVADLAEAGYVGSWIRLRASDVGAPHKRERVFVLATNTERVRINAGAGLRGRGTGEPGRSPQEVVSAWAKVARAEDTLSDRPGPLADAVRERLDWSGGGDAQTPSGGEEHGWSGLARYPASIADTNGGGFASIRESELADLEGEGGYDTDRRAREGEEAPTPDADGERRSQHGRPLPREAKVSAADGDSERREWGIYAPAILRWERELGRSAPRPTDDRGRLNPEFTAWMMGFPEKWTAGETRTQQLRMLGNAVQVQCGEVVGRMLRG